MILKNIGLALTALVMTSAAAQADSTVRGMVEIGGGTETAINQAGGWNVLLRVETGIRRISDATVIAGLDQLILVHIDGQIAVNPDNSSSDRIPYMNMRFIPISSPHEIPNPNGSGQRMDIQILPSAIHRDTRVGRDFAIRTSLVGIEIGASSMINDAANVAVFLDMAADLIGYKVIQQNGGYGTFHAFHLGGVSADIGLAFNINQSFIVKVSVGGGSDMNFGGGDHRGLQSDQTAFARIELNVTRFIELYAQIGLINMSDTGADRRTVHQFMTGLNVTFL